MDENKYHERLIKKEERALLWFIDKYAAYVGAVIGSVTRGAVAKQDIEEAAADVFLVLWDNAADICEGKIKAYLAATARNKAKMLLRSVGRTVPLDDDILNIEGDDIEQRLTKKEQAEAVRKAVLSMKQPARDIFLRYYYLYQTVEEIAFEMQMNPSTVKTHLRRGRERLKEILVKGGYGYEDKDIRHA